MKTLLDELPQGGNFRITGHGIVVKKDDQRYGEVRENAERDNMPAANTHPPVMLMDLQIALDTHKRRRRCYSSEVNPCLMECVVHTAAGEDTAAKLTTTEVQDAVLKVITRTKASPYPNILPSLRGM